MKLAIALVILTLISSMTTFAWAVGVTPQALMEWPWLEIGLLALPILGISAARLRRP